MPSTLHPPHSDNKKTTREVLTVQALEGWGEPTKRKNVVFFFYFCSMNRPHHGVYSSLCERRKKDEKVVFFCQKLFFLPKILYNIHGQRLCIHSYTCIICFPGSITKNALFSGWIFHSADHDKLSYKFITRLIRVGHTKGTAQDFCFWIFS